MKKYELYKIIIISPAPDSQAVSLHVLSSYGMHVISLRSFFRDRRSNIPKRLSADSDWLNVNLYQY